MAAARERTFVAVRCFGDLCGPASRRAWCVFDYRTEIRVSSVRFTPGQNPSRSIPLGATAGDPKPRLSLRLPTTATAAQPNIRPLLKSEGST